MLFYILLWIGSENQLVHCYEFYETLLFFLRCGKKTLLNGTSRKFTEKTFSSWMKINWLNPKQHPIEIVFIFEEKYCSMFNLISLVFVSVLSMYLLSIIANCSVLFVYLCSILSGILCTRLQSPPASAKVPKSVSDRKRFFENAMEDHNKPAPKSGKSIVFNYFGTSTVKWI